MSNICRVMSNIVMLVSDGMSGIVFMGVDVINVGMVNMGLNFCFFNVC